MTSDGLEREALRSAPGANLDGAFLRGASGNCLRLQFSDAWRLWRRRASLDYRQLRASCRSALSRNLLAFALDRFRRYRALRTPRVSTSPVHRARRTLPKSLSATG